LNLITGQLKPTLGDLRVFGHSPRNNAALFRRLGYCPGSDGLYADVSGLEWVCYLQQLQGTVSARTAAIQALETVGMREAMHRPINTYSRGMRQRTKLAQAIAHDPDFLILDEPFNGLDPVGRHEMTVALRRWIDQGKSLLLASHILHEVESITQSFLLICGGRLLASGTAQDVDEMLVDLPNQITLRSEQPFDLAVLLMKHQAGDSVTIDGQAVTLATRHASRLISSLPNWLAGSGISIGEVQSSDESLGELFNVLLKIHRGEV
jgi:ABC-2 type transport system ATP-binding protein